MATALFDKNPELVEENNPVLLYGSLEN